MKVLSLFDGMSCGRIALSRIGAIVDSYHASEIDPYAIKVTQKNYPDTIQLGDVIFRRNWKLPRIDLLIGGSPCQGFSVAGKRQKFLDPRSRLFFYFCDALDDVRKENPDVLFLYENVRMNQDEQDVISKMLEVEPIMLDSSFVSAQSRKRLYWTNIPNVTIPEDKGICLKDVLQPDEDVSPEFWLSEKELAYMNRQTHDGRDHWDFAHHSDTKNDKSASVVANFLKGVPYNVVIDRRLVQVGSLYENNADAGRIYASEGLARTLKGESGGMGGKMGLYKIGDRVRKLTPIECERLQTVPDDYTAGVSKTQRYKMLGNGWTVDVIAHILKGINHE